MEVWSYCLYLLTDIATFTPPPPTLPTPPTNPHHSYTLYCYHSVDNWWLWKMEMKPNNWNKFCILSFSMTGSQRLLQLLLMLWTFQKVRVVVCFTNLSHSERKQLSGNFQKCLGLGKYEAFSNANQREASQESSTDHYPCHYPRLKSSCGWRKSRPTRSYWGLSCKLGYLSVANELFLPCL